MVCYEQEDAGVLVTTALDVTEGFGMFLVINATTMQVGSFGLGICCDNDHSYKPSSGNLPCVASASLAVRLSRQLLPGKLSCLIVCALRIANVKIIQLVLSFVSRRHL